MQHPKGVCVKVSSLRPTTSDLRAWLAHPKHALVCRKGRIFINKQIFLYEGSEFANPFAVKQYGLDECLSRYEEHLTKLLQDPETQRRFTVLGDMEEIGCFCDPGAKCHRDIIIRKLAQLNK